MSTIKGLLNKPNIDSSSNEDGVNIRVMVIKMCWVHGNNVP